MSQKPAIVTAERFASGLTYKEYMAQIKQYKDRFEQYYNSAKISPDDAACFKKASQGKNGAVRILALAEDWSSDVYRELPVIARIAEAGGMELRIFPRDANLDIMNLFLNQGKFQSIPVAVFYTKDMRYITHWIERSVLANQERAIMEADIKKAMPNLTPEEFRLEARKRREPRYAAWQQETVREIRRLLTEKLKI